MSADSRIPLARPDLSDRDRDAVLEVLSSGTLSRGPWLDRFEQAMASRCHRAHAVGVSSGTAALHLALLALDIGPGDEVITTPFTVPATLNPILAVGARPVLVDIDPGTRCPSPGVTAGAVGAATRAIIAVHPFGQPAPMAQLQTLCRQRELHLIEDACEALGTELASGPVGSHGTVSAFGFYPNKVMTTGEGGMALTDDAALAQRMRLLANHGRRMDGSWLDQELIGYNYRLSELQAALGASQMERLDTILARRQAHVDQYCHRLTDSPLRLPKLPLDCQRVGWFSLVVELPSECERADRDRLVSEAADAGIQLGRYFAPLHRQPAILQRLGLDSRAFPNTDAVASRCVALPLFNALGRDQIDRVCDFLLQWIDQ